jgi:hypothetical protein
VVKMVSSSHGRYYLFRRTAVRGGR